MKVVITGTSRGIGFATAVKFLSEGHEVIGIDRSESTISNERYTHYKCDIRGILPHIEDVEILIHNAGTQQEDDIEINLLGTINVQKKYGFQKSIKSVLFNASVSGLSGDEFPEYAASKAGMIGYAKNCAKKLAHQRATCNALCLGGVETELNKPVMSSEVLWGMIMGATPMKRWATADECADWIYFLTVVNKSCTGQAICVDNGEKDVNSTFAWPD